MPQTEAGMEVRTVTACTSDDCVDNPVNCFRVGVTREGTVLLRNTTDPTACIAGSREELAALIAAAKTGRLDCLLE